MPPALLQDLLPAPRYLGWLLDGWLMTLWTAILVIAAASALGALYAAVREAGGPASQRAAAAYLSLVRNTPLLVQLLFWYFGLPSLLPDGMLGWLNGGHALSVGGWVIVRWPSFEFLAAFAGLAVYSAAYVGEDIRSGLRGVPPGQRAAAAALGFTPAQAMRHVVLPQALRIARPPLLGQAMNILKNTSVGMAIGLAELSYRARQAEAETWKTFQIYGVATVLYIAAIALLAAILRRAWRSPPHARSLAPAPRDA
ncbi:amino acid ABC transporter permease [Paracidovorax cattleyae]|uniref:Amino acid ABC transporter membrane protein 1, PAAT family n=1 Tax=Paracidovorax cattleyae TaxID=80868 RepID=A0A1H0QM91_9BURK|nr:amino acid ABC transporter permease [Paracidovorax cattleyae]MBF9265856.1 amino acid ABC transporter permease [Paracidovorax cattleyae]SDP17849.1 amino acid ABC transporter membrane protein 1, PAAT family [Paracidovorax cattleyae]